MNPLCKRFIAVVIFTCVCTGWSEQVCHAQSFQFPPYGAQRGRMVARDGIGHSVRYRWGNGLTPAGAAVIGDAITAFAPAVVAIAGRDVDTDADTRSRDAARSATRDRLAIAQEQANALLVRTARLLEPDFEVFQPTPSGSGEVSEAPISTGVDPWPSVPDNAGASPTPPTESVPPSEPLPPSESDS